MRKFVTIPLAAFLVLAVVAPASAGASTSNSSSSAMTAQAYWYSDEGDVGRSGGLYAWQESGASSAYLDYFEEVGVYVDCTPADDTDDSWGFQGQYIYGYGEGTLTIGRASADAQASGTLETFTTQVDDCAGDWSESESGSVAVSFDLVATGTKMMERGTSSFKIPSEYNGHSSYSSTFRIAAGSASIDGSEIAVDGAIGKVTWRDHGNG